MTDYPTAAEAITQLFADTWSPTGFQFVLGNEKFDPETDVTAGEPWARAVIRHNAATQSTLGQTANRQFDRFGALFVQIFTPEQEGTRRSSDLVQRVVAGFEGARISGTTICMNDTIVREVGPSDGFYMVVVEAQFRYTELK